MVLLARLIFLIATLIFALSCASAQRRVVRDSSEEVGGSTPRPRVRAIPGIGLRTSRGYDSSEESSPSPSQRTPSNRQTTTTKSSTGGVGRRTAARPRIDSSEEIPAPRAEGFAPRTPVQFPRIFGGVLANDSYPWQVSLKKANSDWHFCGGSLISSRHVLTAAHCLDRDSSPSSYKVMVGSKMLNGGQYVYVDRITTHESYGGRSKLDNDVAILHLASAVHDPRASPVTLAETDAPVGKRCMITGWGRTSNGSGAATELRQAVVTIHSRENCAAKWRSQIAIDNTMICTWDSASDTCPGDSGGPLVCMGSSGRWELQGVVSFGAPGCGDTSQPSVFARVPLLKNWIVQNSGYNNDNNNNNDNDKPVPIHQTTSLE